MREERRQPKNPETVKIPQNLSSFLVDVHQIILEESEDATIESDDLLQCEYAYGGLEDSQTGIYSFTYFPDEQGLPASSPVIKRCVVSFPVVAIGRAAAQFQSYVALLGKSSKPIVKEIRYDMSSDRINKLFIATLSLHSLFCERVA